MSCRQRVRYLASVTTVVALVEIVADGSMWKFWCEVAGSLLIADALLNRGDRE